MKVSEFIKWLQEFPDQEAVVEVVEHTVSSGYYNQGGNATTSVFDPEKHVDYTDFRGNPHVKPEQEWYNKRILILGAYDY